MIKVGDQMPQGTFMTMTKDGPKPLTTDELFKGKTVVLFGLPGAFTPTCSAKHVPSYVQNFDALKAKGVDAVACMSVNDAFVMGAWAKHQSADEKVQMLADGSAEYTKKLGLDLDLSARGMGMRCKRFSVLVKDGKAAQVNVEQNPGELAVSGADTILGQL
jgi:peroxiredoxin (alkyl hydroperoxide reductase subunit C)